jgi:hypothetical protein
MLSVAARLSEQLAVFTKLITGDTKMNTEFVFAVTATVLIVVALVLTFRFAPRRREMFMFDLLNMTFGSGRAPKRFPHSTMGERHAQKPRRVFNRVADRAEPIHTPECFETANAPAAR